jgi:putative PIN family toxin of toxin-antitoxin system
MIRVVLDTNVLVSAVIKTEGAEAAALDLATQHLVQLCSSGPILNEYVEVLNRPRLRLDPVRVRWVLEFISREGLTVAPMARLDACPDEPDNRFLECADAASAGYLVTGNKRHFPEYWKSTGIMNARDFLRHAAPSGP